VRDNPNGNCLGLRKRQADGKAGPFEFLSYREVDAEVREIAAGLRSLGEPAAKCADAAAPHAYAPQGPRRATPWASAP
jgi:hypothetical protein